MKTTLILLVGTLLLSGCERRAMPMQLRAATVTIRDGVRHDLYRFDPATGRTWILVPDGIQNGWYLVRERDGAPRRATGETNLTFVPDSK